MMDATVSVVIPTRNRHDLLRRVLNPLLEDPATLEVIVVEDGGDDDSWELLRRWSGREPRLRIGQTLGAGRTAARQRGFSLSAGEIVLLIDDDVVAQPGLVSGHRRAHAATGRQVVVGYMPVPVAREAAQTLATQLYAQAYERHCSMWEQDSDQLLLSLWGGNVSIRRGLLERAGGPVGPLTFDGEDRELGLRLLRAGGDAVFLRSLAAAHLHSRTMAAFAREGYEQGRSRRILHSQHADLIGELDRDSYLETRRPMSRRLLRWSRRPGVSRLLCRALERVVWVAGSLHMAWLESEAASFWRVLERQRGLLAREPTK